MFDNLTLIAVVVIIFWVAIFGYYMVTSRSQKNLQQDIEDLQKLLEDDHKKQD